jgi:Ion transport protein
VARENAAIKDGLLCLCEFQWKQEERHTGPLAMVSTGLTLVFVVEVLMKIIAFTPHGYWQSRRNRYDLFVTVMGVLWIILNSWLRVRIFLLLYTRRDRSIFSFFALLFKLRMLEFFFFFEKRVLNFEPVVFRRTT